MEIKSLKNVLLDHRTKFLELYNLPVEEKLKFETFFGSDCVRVSIKDSDSETLNIGYSPDKFGYLSIYKFNLDIIRTLKSYNLHYINRLERIINNIIKK